MKPPTPYEPFSPLRPLPLGKECFLRPQQMWRATSRAICSTWFAVWFKSRQEVAHAPACRTATYVRQWSATRAARARLTIAHSRFARLLSPPGFAPFLRLAAPSQVARAPAFGDIWTVVTMGRQRARRCFPCGPQSGFLGSNEQLDTT